MNQTAAEQSAEQGLEYAALARLISLTLWSLILLIGFIVGVLVLGGSQTVGAVLIDCLTGLLLQVFNWGGIKGILRQNAFSHP